jgi:hypothetical protein
MNLIIHKANRNMISKPGRKEDNFENSKSNKKLSLPLLFEIFSEKQVLSLITSNPSKNMCISIPLSSKMFFFLSW